MLFFHLYEMVFFYFLYFPICNNVYPKHYQSYKKAFNDVRNFIFENYYKRFVFSKGDSYYSMKRLKKKDLWLFAHKLIEKVPNPHNTKEHYESYLRKKPRKLVKQSETITYQPNIFDTVDIKSVITEHPKTSHKLCKTS